MIPTEKEILDAMTVLFMSDEQLVYDANMDENSDNEDDNEFSGANVGDQDNSSFTKTNHSGPDPISSFSHPIVSSDPLSFVDVPVSGSSIEFLLAQLLATQTAWRQHLRSTDQERKEGKRERALWEGML
jgi:hypothetical protein